MTRAVGFLSLAAGVAGCCSPQLPCVSGKMRPHPIYVDPEAFCALEQQIDCLNHRFTPYEVAMDRCVLPKRVCKRVIDIDNDLQHANAEMISREVAPEKIVRQLARIESDLSWVEARLCVETPPNACCKSPRAMAASLDAQLAATRNRNRLPARLPLAETADSIGNKLDANTDQHQAHEAGQGIEPMRVQPPGNPH